MYKYIYVYCYKVLVCYSSAYAFTIDYFLIDAPGKSVNIGKGVIRSKKNCR